MLQTIRRWVRNGIAPIALLVLSAAAGCRLEPYWDGRPMAGPKNPTCYPENEWGGFYPTCWRQWPECAPRCKKEGDLAVSVDEGAPEKTAPFSSETPVPEKPKTAPEAKKPAAPPAGKPAAKPEAPPAVKSATPKPPAPAPLKTSSNDAMPEVKPAEPVDNAAPAMEDEAARASSDDGWVVVEEGTPSTAKAAPPIRQTSVGE